MVDMPQKDWSDYACPTGPDTRQADKHGWLPIESAPRVVHPHVDLWLRDGRRAIEAWYNDVRDMWFAEGWPAGIYPNEITHYRPLPQPPEDGQ